MSKCTVYLFSLPLSVSKFIANYSGRNAQMGFTCSLILTEIGRKCGIAEMEKGHSTRPYLSSGQMKAQSDASITGLVTVTETVRERVQQPKEPAACRPFMT